MTIRDMSYAAVMARKNEIMKQSMGWTTISSSKAPLHLTMSP